MADSAETALLQLTALRKLRFVLLRLEAGRLVLDTAAPRSGTFADLERALPAADCRFAVYDHEFGSAPPKLYFVSWAPHAAPEEAKLEYARARTDARSAGTERAVDVDAACMQQLMLGVGACSDLDDDDRSLAELSSPVCFMSFMAF